MDQTSEYLERYAGAKILITGGSGSIGSTVAKGLLQYSKCNRIVILSRDETLQWKAKQKFEAAAGKMAVAVKTSYVIGSIEDNNILRETIVRYGVDTVIHTASMKHVPMCEENPKEAVNTNLGGTINVIHACEAYGVHQLILVSSDKAAEPVSVMGMTKFLQERMVINSTIPEVQVVRFGNVLGSRGSVVWTFKKQLDTGTSLTITDPNMKRYFMSPSEAAEFVLWGGARLLSKNIGIKRMRSCTVENLAKAVANGADIKMNVIGRRPGEKDDEVLLSSEEKIRTMIIDSSIGPIATIFPAPPSSALCDLSSFDINNNLVGVDELIRVLKSGGIINE